MECKIYRRKSDGGLELYIDTVWILGKDNSKGVWIPESLSLNGTTMGRDMEAMEAIEMTPELQASIEHYAGAKKLSGSGIYVSKILSTLFSKYRNLSK
jgi:hypothetical protein